MHESREWTCKATPNASTEPKVKTDGYGTRKKHIDDVVVVQGHSENGEVTQHGLIETPHRAPKAGVRPNPASDSREKERHGETEDSLTEHVEPVPLRSVRHLLPMRISESLSQGPARANPATVSSLPPTANHQRNDHEGLEAPNHEPPGHRFRGEKVPNEERPCQDQSKGSPVLPAMPVIGNRKQVVCHGPPEP